MRRLVTWSVAEAAVAMPGRRVGRRPFTMAAGCDQDLPPLQLAERAAIGSLSLSTWLCYAESEYFLQPTSSQISPKNGYDVENNLIKHFRFYSKFIVNYSILKQKSNVDIVSVIRCRKVDIPRERPVLAEYTGNMEQAITVHIL